MAVFGVLDTDVKAHTGSKHNYYLGEMNGKKVVIAPLPVGRTGKAAAAGTVAALCNEVSSIELVFMVGICGGVPFENTKYDKAINPGEYKRPNVRLGDVIVSYPIKTGGPAFLEFDYGKIRDIDTRENIKANLKDIFKCSLRLSNKALEAARTVKDLYENIRETPWEGDIAAFQKKDNTEKFAKPASESGSSSEFQLKPDEAPQVHFGIIASSDSVMRNAEVRNAIAEAENIIGFEMENAGVATAADMEDKRCMFVRGVCDHSDEGKEKSWQPFAALAAAAVTKSIIAKIPGN
ncbi:uncharacterized protein [Ptychodera flava]|uniref:uncharacterized protein n=1 Tax=Ptychodera flava TaxID=63121 RepID=UPI00396A9282